MEEATHRLRSKEQRPATAPTQCAATGPGPIGLAPTPWPQRGRRRLDNLCAADVAPRSSRIGSKHPVPADPHQWVPCPDRAHPRTPTAVDLNLSTPVGAGHRRWSARFACCQVSGGVRLLFPACRVVAHAALTPPGLGVTPLDIR